jgi:streptogramin lyase
MGVAVDSFGDLFIADTNNNVIRRVDAVTGVITTFAGNGFWGYTGDGGTPTDAELENPTSVVVDPYGDLLIADFGNRVIRDVSAWTGEIYTYADGLAGYPTSLAMDSSGNLFIAEPIGSLVQEVTISNGKLITAAGTYATYGYSGDGGKAAAAVLSEPSGVAVDSAGDLFIADTGNNVVREVGAATGIIRTIAGNGTAGYHGDGGPASGAELNQPRAVAIDAYGNVFVADTANYVVREVTPFTVITSAKVVKTKTGKKASQEEIVIQFSAALDPAGAQDLSVYSLGTVPKGKRGKGQAIALGQASYNAKTFTVTLLPRKPLKIPPAVQLRVRAARLLDRFGSPLDDGRDYLALFHKG